jgi:hypothetical protein
MFPEVSRFLQQFSKTSDHLHGGRKKYFVRIVVGLGIYEQRLILVSGWQV